MKRRRSVEEKREDVFMVDLDWNFSLMILKRRKRGKVVGRYLGASGRGGFGKPIGHPRAPDAAGIDKG